MQKKSARIVAASLLALGLGCAGLRWAHSEQSTPPALVLKHGDHIAILGNTLADRMQHDGYFESLIYQQFPKLDLTVRNLAAAADEVGMWHRSDNFGTRDEWLGKVKADVIFCFYGYNESFAGPAGVDEFKHKLESFIKEMQSRNFDGKGAPRLVFFSPIANEKTQNPNFPDPKADNANIALYAVAIEEVAKANGAQYVNLLKPSEDLYAAAAKEHRSLTINGIHLSEEGDKQLAPIMFEQLFAAKPPGIVDEELRTKVVNKNEEWHSRYRTVDGFNVFGGRSAESYLPLKGGQKSDRNSESPWISNYRVMQEEMAQRDQMTINRDKEVWSTAQGNPITVKDDNLPPVERVITNYPGPNPDHTWPYMPAEQAISKMTVAKGCKVNVFATEEQFPELINPVQMAWDTKGRLWVSAWRNYPERTPTSAVGDSILIFEDTKGTGHADKCTHFIDNLNCPTGFNFYKDGILLMEAPDLWYVPEGPDGKAGKIERVVMGMDSADSHHTTNSMVLDPGGGIYLSDGVFHRTQVETAAGPVRNEDACIYRFEPKTGRFERYIPYGFANPHGRVFDYWGNDIVTDATGNNSYFGPAFSGHLDYPAKHDSLKDFWNRPSRPCPGTNIITSRAFPPEWQGNFLNCNVIGFQGIYRVKMAEEGSGVTGTSLEDLISSTESNFRPTGVNVGPDGALYVMDWSQSIIGHLQHHLRDENRDHEHGRLYRITYEGLPLLKPTKIAGQPIEALLDLLKEPENDVRTRAKIELDKHDAAEVIVAVDKWSGALDKMDPAYEHHMTEALWVHQWENVVDEALLKRMLRSSVPEARAAATRVLCYWRDRVADALPLLKVQAADENPRVRLEAVRAASFFSDPQAVDVALESLKFPRDYYLEYVLKQTMRQLDPIWHKALATGGSIAADNPAGIDYLIGSVSTPELMKLPRSPGVLQAILLRADAADADRNTALNDLAAARKMPAAAVLVSSLEGYARSDSPKAVTLARLLPSQSNDDLAKLRDRLVKLLGPEYSAEVHEPVWAAIATADQSMDKVWAQAKANPQTLTELLNGIPFIFDPDIRNQAHKDVLPIASVNPPTELAGTAKSAAANGRYVRIELPRNGTLTLAEVQVFSGGRNIALHGTATESSISNGGEAGRAIDGRTDGNYQAGTSTHTTENSPNPWWQVDLGSDKPIESVVIWNRTDGNFGERLQGFNLRILDSAKHEIFHSDNNAAPSQSAKIDVAPGDPVEAMRLAAIRALISMKKEVPATFGALATLIEKKTDVAAAASGIRVLPRQSWEKDKFPQIVQSLVEWAKTIPANDRTSSDYIQTVQFASDLAGTLPAEQGNDARTELKKLRVAVFVVNTVREQMRYDTSRIVVEAGKPFEIRLENMDMMPHNLSIVNPGTRAAVAAEAANLSPVYRDSHGRAFMPNDPNILAATPLLEPGQQAILKVKAPEKEGDYDYFCTYPGHWEVMWGRLVVTKDVDSYLQQHPQAELPGAPGTDHHHH